MRYEFKIMNQHKYLIHKMRMVIYVALLIIFISLGFSLRVKKIQAQSAANWSDPINLSQSGSASEPAIVVNSSSSFHVVWIDEFDGNKYVSGNALEWSQPVVADLPFKDAVPKLLADKEGYIHAFWLDKSNALFYSAMQASDFASASSWTPPVQLAESTLDFGITVDQNDDLDLTYIKPVETTEYPAGVYYLKLVKGNTAWAWSSPVLLDSSPYFRTLKLEDSSADIATSTIDGEIQVYAVWDNRPRERVYLIISPDGGQTWGTPKEIDKPDIGSGYNSTSKILVEANKMDVLLVWQRSSTGGFCSHYYQKSNDGGETWSQPNEVSSGSSSCGQEDQLFNDGNGMVYLWTILQNQVNLYAWNWQRWSNPQVQNELSAFTDPETEKLVVYDCRQPVLDGSQRLAVAGCDTNGGGDIWFTDRQLDDAANWFSSETAWSEVEEFVSSQTEIDAPVLLAAPDNHLLALWSQADQATGNTDQEAIHLARWDGESWTQTGPIFRSAQGSLAQPSAAIDDKGRVNAVWSSSEDGKLYFSWANIANSQNPSEWTEPVTLPISQALAHSPQILVDKSGDIDVVYSVPVNEERGIYLIRSQDGGVTWSSPVKIFDGVIANWQSVDYPLLVETSDGGLHTLWSQRSVLDGGVILGLYYARSEDNGNTWSEPEIVTDSEVMWSQIATLDQGTLVRMWQGGNQLQPLIKYQFSQDSGLNWSTEESLGSFGEKSLMAKLVTTPTGNLHMLQVVQTSAGDLFLRDWLWENGRWSVNEYINLTDGLLEEAYSMESTVSSDGNLAMVLSAKTNTQPGNLDRYGLIFTNRVLGLPTVKPTLPTTAPSDSPPPSPTATPVFTPIATQVVQATPTPDLATNVFTESPTSSSNSFMSAGRGVLLSALIIVAAIIIGIWRVRRNR